MDSVELRGVSAGYGNSVIVKNLSLSVAAGEIIGIIGSNGCGKSTIMKVIAGINRQKSGAVLFDGVQISRGERSKLVGYCPQENGFFEKLTVMENLKYFGRLYGMGGRSLDDGAKKVVKMLGLEGKEDSLADTLSGGQKRRLNIGCGIIISPRILLMDEPSLALDPASKYRLWTMIKSINSQGVTVIISSNSFEEVNFLCKRVVGIKSGSVAFVRKGLDASDPSVWDLFGEVFK